MRFDIDHACCMMFLSANSVDVRAALELVPPGWVAADGAAAVYLASLRLAVGQVDEALRLLSTPTGGVSNSSTNAVVRLAGALRRLIDLVRTGTPVDGPSPIFATEWLVESLARQARSDQTGSWRAARSTAPWSARCRSISR